MHKVYIVEDDENIRGIVLYALQSVGFETEGFETGADFFGALEEGMPDLVLLDIMLPGCDGLTVLRRLRDEESTKKLPVIMLTAKSSEIDKVKGLDIGADDYITKPFGVMELVSRINAVLRRSLPQDGPQDGQITAGNIMIDTARREVMADNQKINLTFKEYELLCYLAVNAGLALSRDKILEIIWGFDFECDSRTLDVHIRSLRSKLGGAGAQIKTVRNVGYKLITG